MKPQRTILMKVLIVLGVFVSACGAGEPEAPTLGVPAIQSAAVAIFSSGLTQTALAAPTNTATQTNTPAPTFSAATLGTVTPFGSGLAPNPTAGCYSLSFVADVTIPDNSPMTPGQTFTKTWKVRNGGTCAWEAGFKFAFTGGDNMNGATYSLPQSVPANTELNISIEMTAPTNKTGSLRGNWRLSTAAGGFFGDEVYVMILIGGTAGTVTKTSTTAAGNTSTAAPTGTDTPTPTATLP